jgi:hypothetical protein
MVQARNSEHPEQPLLVFVGSSHVANGINPDAMSGMQTSTGESILPINFAHLTAGPELNLLQVKRFLQVSKKPNWLVVEVFPYACADEKRGYVHMTSWNDLSTISHFHSYRKFAGSFLRNHFLVPWYRHRADLQQHYLNEDLQPAELAPMTATGWLPFKESISDDERRGLIDAYHKLYAPTLGDAFQILPSSAQAFHELLTLCRDQGIKLALILMPEGQALRSWYSPMASKRLYEFVQQLSAEYGVKIFDTREWYDDSCFADSKHLMVGASGEFTRRLERELLQPWILE